jgi:hypothetical protein
LNLVLDEKYEKEECEKDERGVLCRHIVDEKNEKEESEKVDGRGV